MFKTKYSEKLRFYTQIVGDSKTHQSFKHESEISNIIAKYQKTGVIEHRNKYDGDYGDFVGFDDFHAMQNKILAAQDMFESLPSNVRKRFSNDPSQYLAFVQNPDNHQEMYDLGLAVRPPAPPPTETPPEVPPASSE